MDPHCNILPGLYSFKQASLSNSVCFLFIQGARVYPTLIGQRNYQVNETRRVRFSAQVLERLNLAVSMKDKLGGTIWKGRHLLPEWYEEQRHLFSDQLPEILQEPIIVLRRAVFAKKKLGMAVKDCKKYLATLPRKPEQSNKDCKKYLATALSKPEQSDKYCNKYLATLPRKSEQSNEDCKKYLTTVHRKPEQSNKGLFSKQQPSHVRQRRRFSTADSSRGCPSEDKKLRSRRKVRNFSQNCSVNYTDKSSRT